MKQADPVFIVGPTGVGKSQIAVEIAQALDGEIVGADAFQVYRGMPVLTAQPDEKLQALVPHHLIGCVGPAESFDAGAYLKCAQAAIAEIHARGRVPIVVGGTGLYIKAITHGLSETPPIDPEIRAGLENSSLEELLARLEKRDPEIAKSIDRKNRRRVQRALEICIQTGNPASRLRESWSQAPRPHCGVFLTRERDELCARIDRNVALMPDLGVMEEIRKLGPLSETARKAIGCEDALLQLENKLSLQEWIIRTQQASRRYAKRQLTWFRNQTTFSQFNLTAISNIRDSLLTVLRGSQTE